MQRKDSSKPYTYSLISLVATDMCLNEEEFNFAIDSSPLVENISIMSAGLSDENLYRLMTLSRLTRFDE